MGYRYDKYGKTVTPHEHSMKLERGDSDAIAYQKYIEQNPELHNLTENMGVGDVRKYTAIPVLDFRKDGRNFGYTVYQPPW